MTLRPLLLLPLLLLLSTPLLLLVPWPQPVEERIECLDGQKDYIYWARDHRLAWCKVPKAGSTSWVDTFTRLAGQGDRLEGEKSNRGEKSDYDQMHENFRTLYPVTPDLQEVQKESLMFHIVRHPLERLLSAYRDKLEGGNKSYWLHLYGQPSWREFISQVLSTPPARLDEHWRPIHLLCSPCLRWDTIIRMETFGEDTDYVLARAGLLEKLGPMGWKHRISDSSSQFSLHRSYFSQLTVSEVEGLVQLYQGDFSLYHYDPEPFLWMAESGQRES